MLSSVNAAKRCIVLIYNPILLGRLIQVNRLKLNKHVRQMIFGSWGGGNCALLHHIQMILLQIHAFLCVIWSLVFKMTKEQIIEYPKVMVRGFVQHDVPDALKSVTWCVIFLCAAETSLYVTRTCCCLRRVRKNALHFSHCCQIKDESSHWPWEKKCFAFFSLDTDWIF